MNSSSETNNEPRPYVGEKCNVGLTRMQDGTYRSAVAIYDENDTELLRVPYDDAAKVLLAAYALKSSEQA